MLLVCVSDSVATLGLHGDLPTVTQNLLLKLDLLPIKLS